MTVLPPTFLRQNWSWALSNVKKKCSLFPKLDIAPRKTKLNSGKLKVEVENHLRLLKQEFERYFPDLSDIKLPKLKMKKNLFENDIFSKDLQKEFLEMKRNSTAKKQF